MGKIAGKVVGCGVGIEICRSGILPLAILKRRDVASTFARIQIGVVGLLGHGPQEYRPDSGRSSGGGVARAGRNLLHRYTAVHSARGSSNKAVGVCQSACDSGGTLVDTLDVRRGIDRSKFSDQHTAYTTGMAHCVRLFVNAAYSDRCGCHGSIWRDSGVGTRTLWNFWCMDFFVAWSDVRPAVRAPN